MLFNIDAEEATKANVPNHRNSSFPKVDVCKRDCPLSVVNQVTKEHLDGHAVHVSIRLHRILIWNYR